MLNRRDILIGGAATAAVLSLPAALKAAEGECGISDVAYTQADYCPITKRYTKMQMWFRRGNAWSRHSKVPIHQNDQPFPFGYDGSHMEIDMDLGQLMEGEPVPAFRYIWGEKNT